MWIDYGDKVWFNALEYLSMSKFHPSPIVQQISKSAVNLNIQKQLTFLFHINKKVSETQNTINSELLGYWNTNSCDIVLC